MPENFDLLSRPDTMVVFTTAPTGFGHLRVTLALKDALPNHIITHILGIHDPTFEISYGLISRHPLSQGLFEMVQNHGFLEDSLSLAYRHLLNFSSQKTYAKLTKLISQQPVTPTTLIVVATHFSLAHQISHCKTKLERQFHLKLVLAIVVTDDSPQHIWAVPQADYIFVPSQTTKLEIERYLSTITTHPPKVLISPYPLSPILSRDLSDVELESRKRQLDSQSSELTQILIPVSGAAVQLTYLRELITVLLKNPRLSFTVVSRQSAYCDPFLAWCKTHPQIKILSHKQDDQVVKLYENAYTDTVFSLEVTKPSEQSFKALLPPNTRGGLILLFSPPVGRQEVDNLTFLRRHNLLSNPHTSPHQWRAISLPKNGTEAGKKIIAMLKTDVFRDMNNFTGFLPHPELKPNGAQLFWLTLKSLFLPDNLSPTAPSR